MNGVDFLPQRIKARRLRRRRLKAQACLLVLCAGLAAMLSYVRQGRIATARADVAMIVDHAGDVRSQVGEAAKLETQLGQLRVVGRIEQDLGRRVNTLKLLAELERRMPPALALTNLKIETVVQTIPVRPVGLTHRAGKAVVAEDKKLRRVRLTLAGLAPSDVDVATFIGQLSAGPLFEDVNMGYTRSERLRGRTVRSFQASCYVAR